MATFTLYQKGPEYFYGTILPSMNIVYKKMGSTINQNVNSNYSQRFEYPLDDPMIISTATVNRLSDGEGYTIELTCTIPKCVDVSVKGMDFYGHELPDLDTPQYWSMELVDGTDSTYIILIKNIFSEAFMTSNATMDTIYAACLVFNFKEGTSFVNMSTNSYNEAIGEVSDKFTDGSNISYAFMTKPSDVQSYVRIPMYFEGNPADVFSNTTPLTIQTNYPLQTSSYFKGYYIGHSSSNISDDDFELGKNGGIYQTSINEIYNNILTEQERTDIIDGANINLCIYMHYSAPRQITPFNQRKKRIIKAY